LTIAVWTLLFIPAALTVTLVASRLLGVRRSFFALLLSGAIGWLAGLWIAGAFTHWAWSEKEMVLLTILFGTLLTMIVAVGLDMLAPPGSLARGDAAGRISLVGPAHAWRATIAPLGRYRELISIARSNGLLRHRIDFNDPAAVEALGPPLRRTLEEAGGIFVKLGQVASTRSDLLPPDLCKELALLRSSATPASKDDVQPLIRDELGKPVTEAFGSFDWEPIASASVAQVYAATLHDGTDVVVKVERPGINAVIERDSAVVDQVADALERHTTAGLTLRPRDIADEFLAGVREELDFTIEAANARALAAATAPDAGVRLPRVYRDVSTSRVLVEERIFGVQIDDVAALRDQGLEPHALAERLMRVFMTQIFDAGVFHADPHPGNILVEADGTIVLIDLGAVGRLGKNQQQLFTQLLAGAMTADARVVREALDDAGLVEGNVQSTDLDSAIDEFLAKHVGTGQGLTSEVIEELFAMLSQFGIRPPQWMTALGRTFVTLEGTLKSTDPSFSLIDSAMLAATERVHTLPRPDTIKDAVEAEAVRQLPRLRRLPQRLDDLLGQASRGRLTARVSLLADDEDLNKITRLADRAVLAILAAALGVGSALVLDAHSGPVITGEITLNEILGYIGLAVALILTLRVVAAIIRDGVT
jgi:ubiquinone biosynthesis protein